VKNEEFLTKLAKQYVKEAGEKYKLENDELAQSPLLGLDKKTKAVRRRQTWQRHRLTFMGVAASIIIIVIAGIAFLPEMLREYATSTDMAPTAPMSAPPAAAGGMVDSAMPTAPAPPPAAAQPPAAAAPLQPTPSADSFRGVADEAPAAQRQQNLDNVVTEATEQVAPAEPPALFGAVAEIAEELEFNIMFDDDTQIITPNQAITNFSQNMFSQVLAMGEENAVISPLSAYYVLAMVAQGAAGQTLEEFDHVLGFSSRALPRELESLTLNLTLPHWDTTLNIAGSVWVHDQMTVNTAFNQTMQAYFSAPAKSRNFFAPQTIPEINQWVYNNTEGLIDSIVEELDPDAVMLLINALYFKGQWANEMRYTPNVFRTAAGENIQMNFLSTSASFQMAQTPQFEAALLPYSCGRFGFLLVRPTNGLTVRDFAAAYSFADIIASLRSRYVTIQMPGLDFAYEIGLNDILQNMGLVSAFDFSTADFSELIYTGDSLEISDILQKVRIRVDRYGTEAAAVTAAGMRLVGGMPTPAINLIFDTPYMYAILDITTGMPLFMGVVDNPRG